MPLIQSLISQLAAGALRAVAVLAGKDHRLAIIERRLRLLRLLRELREAGLTWSQLRKFDRRLTKD
jgi:hypothetical protein